jgi:hypothetical protein
LVDYPRQPDYYCFKMRVPGILAVGERLPDVEALVDAIRSDQAECSSAPNSLWTIDNKYYTAQVAISIMRNENNHLNPPSAVDHQAVVAVFNATLDTLENIQRLWAAVENQDPEFEIKLAVVLCIDGCLRPDWLEQANAWFAERGAELIVVEELERVDAPRLAAAVGEGDSEGIQRVVEALQAHVWPGMQRKVAAKECTNSGGSGRKELPMEAEPSIEALLQETFLQDDTVEDRDEADKLFAEVLGRFPFILIYRSRAKLTLTQLFERCYADFRQKMGGTSRRQRADAAAELLTRLHALMGENSEAGGSIGDSDSDDEKQPSPILEALQ